jgi:isocitrate dehydrogenase kinase/phosphatase
MQDPAYSPDTATAVAEQLVAAFVRYNDDFREITRRATRCFEECDWAQNRRDAVERIELYDRSVNRAIAGLGSTVDTRKTDRAFWSAVKREYSERIADYPDNAFFKTFFSSTTRRVFKTVGVDPDVEFLASDVTVEEKPLDENDVRTYHNRGATDLLIDQVLSDFRFGVPYRDWDVTVRFIAAEIDAYCKSRANHRDIEIVELLRPVFYRATRAFIVGRIGGDDWVTPLVIALRNSDDGIVADAVILSVSDVSMLFSFTRSYFHADLQHVGATVGFLLRLLPHKPMDEIYTALGRAKQGKTERYRALFQHFRTSRDLIERASGVKGMVMEVFTLPSYDVVFKVIRDHFAYPKTGSREDVMQKYELVFKRDRAGRLVDAQEFRRLRFPKRRFQPELLDDLLRECSIACRLDGNDVVIEHVYIERRLVPLNLYLESASEQQAIAAAIDYGQSIKDLALSNIFAGDLLLKNFGVTRHGRVIFYDYDELCLVTDCNFRRMPEPQDDVDEMRAGAWFYVGPHDIFPEQFIDFLGFKSRAKQAFIEHHGDLLTPEYWLDLKHRHEAGEIFEVLLPYTVRNRTEHRGHSLVPVQHQFGE